MASISIPGTSLSITRGRSADATSIFLVSAVAVLLGLPMLLYGPLVDGHDAAEHLNLSRHFSEQFWSGDLYPRWLMDMNHGLGSATYFVFPPLPAFLSTLLDPLGRALHFSAFNFAAFLALLTSGICAFFLLRTMTGPTESMLGAMLYMAMPYHLMIDFYLRSAISECWALAWMPLVLYCVPGVVAGKRRAIVGLAVSYALMIFSHLISVAMFSAIPLAFALVLSPAGARIRSAARVAFAMALGVGLSSVYLFPALANAKYISSARFISLWTRSTGANGVLSFGRGLISLAGRPRLLLLISWSDVSVTVLALSCIFALWRVMRRDPNRITTRLTLFWTLVCCFAIFMTSRLSAPLWRNFHRMHQTIQHPWRFSTILCAGVLLLLALMFSERPWRQLVQDTGFRVALALIAVVWIGSYGYVWWRYKVDIAPALEVRTQVLEHDMLFWAWSPPGMDPATGLSTAMTASAGPRASFREGSGTADVRLWKPRQIELDTNSSTGGWVVVSQFYYPSWAARMKDTATSIAIRTALPEGLLEVQVPPGSQHVRIEMPVSWVELTGRWLGLFCVLLCLAIGVNWKRNPDVLRGHRVLATMGQPGAEMDTVA